ncbi:MAG: hypothetical protein ABW321_08920 [Polyangiales bacterium]
MTVPAQLKELILQSLEHERGGVLVYKTALEAAVQPDLRGEWIKYLAQTERHVGILAKVCQTLELDPGELTPTCQIVHNNGRALVVAIKTALAAGNPVAAQLVACESVLLAETKDHANWELLRACAKGLPEPLATPLTAACDEVEEEEDRHLYHTQGWCRELWLESLGLPAVLPPPEETRDVTSASEAEQARAAAH